MWLWFIKKRWLFAYFTYYHHFNLLSHWTSTSLLLRNPSIFIYWRKWSGALESITYWTNKVRFLAIWLVIWKWRKRCLKKLRIYERFLLKFEMLHEILILILQLNRFRKFINLCFSKYNWILVRFFVFLRIISLKVIGIVFNLSLCIGTAWSS